MTIRCCRRSKCYGWRLEPGLAALSSRMRGELWGVPPRLAALGIVFLLALSCTLATGCGGDLTAQPALMKTRYVIFVDRSLSPGAEQLDLWTEAAEKQVFRRLQPGDAVTGYEVTGRTADTAPLIDTAIPPLNDAAGMDGTLPVRRALAAVRREGLEAVKRALRHPVARETRLLDSIRRIPKDDSRKLSVLYLTDALESSPELDLERTQLTDGNLLPLAQAAFARHGWRQGALRGDSVQFVLDSPDAERRRPLNDHQALERFWRLVFTNLGANLTSFDSRIGD